MHSDDESDRDEEFKFHFRVQILPYRAPLLTQIVKHLDKLDASITKAAGSLLVQRHAQKRVERRRVGDIISTSKAPISLPHDLYDSQWLEDHKIHAGALRLAPAVGIKRLILT